MDKNESLNIGQVYKFVVFDDFKVALFDQLDNIVSILKSDNLERRDGITYIYTKKADYVFKNDASGLKLVKINSKKSEDLESVRNWLNELIELTYDSETETVTFIQYVYDYSVEGLRRPNATMIIRPAKFKLTDDPYYTAIVQSKTLYFKLTRNFTQWRIVEINAKDLT